MTVEENIELIENLKVGDNITFYTCCNADRELLKGSVEEHKTLGKICSVEGTNYELRKLVDIRKA